MDRCYKIKVLILFLTCVLIPKANVYSNELDKSFDIKAYPVEAKIKQKKRSDPARDRIFSYKSFIKS
jgi:hypothetical protein